MAMLNIGLLIFGATYALLPELSGKALYSEKLAWIHVWTTFLAGMAVFGIWLVQGLDGAPRRWAVLPSQYDTLTRISLPLVFLLAAAQALFFWNVLQTLRGKSGVATFDERGIPVPAASSTDWSVHVAEAALVLLALALACIFAVGGYLVGREHGKGGGTPTTPVTSTERAPSSATRRPGPMSSRSAGCGGCHVLSAAGSKAPSARRSTPRSRRGARDPARDERDGRDAALRRPAQRAADRRRCRVRARVDLEVAKRSAGAPSSSLRAHDAVARADEVDIPADLLQLQLDVPG